MPSLVSSDDEELVRRIMGPPGGRLVTESPVSSDRSSPLATPTQSPFESNAGNMNGDDDADLFGSDGSDGGFGNHDKPQRTLDDKELDSGDDVDRNDRAESRVDQDDMEGEDDLESVNIMDLSLGRAPEPVTSNGEVYTMPVPNFLSVETEEFNPETYVAPPFATAATSLCWRHDPNNQSLLQSNARIIRWEDGSMTLQLASAPREQYRISIKPLAPTNRAGEYDTKLDSHVYLGAAAEASSVFRLTSHVTHGLTVLPTTVETDDAVQRLQESLAAAARGNKKTADGSMPVIEVKEDPELAKRQAEMAEREKLKAARRRQQLAEKELDRGRRIGFSHRPGGTGLSIGGLEDGGGLLTTRARARKPRKPNRRGEIYTDDEEGYDRRGRTKEDEYDEDDGFLVGSDEEPEVVDDDEEEDILEDDEMDAEGEDDVEVSAHKSTKGKRASPAQHVSEVAAGAPSVRKKNRYIVDDDDEDE